MKPGITFTVPGAPAAQGSKRGFVDKRSGKVRMVEQLVTVGPWRERVAIAAHNAWAGKPVLTGVPVMVSIEFILKRAMGISPKRPTPPAIKRNGDLDKLERAVYDAITGVIIYDDSQVVRNSNSKRIAEPGEAIGAIITVEEIEWPTTN